MPRTYVHVSALVRGPIGPETFTAPAWTPPAATDTERATVARLGGYRTHDYGGITLGDALTREDQRENADDIVTVRGSDGRFWDAFDQRSWMLGAPVTAVALR